MSKSKATNRKSGAAVRSSELVRPSVKLYQSVWITFSDGTRAGYLGQAKALPSDTRTIKNIEFTKPKPMPPNCHFCEMPNAELSHSAHQSSQLMLVGKHTQQTTDRK